VASQIDKYQSDDIATMRNNFATALLLGIAYSASIGGIGTIIGTAPNLLLVSYIEQQYSHDIGFATWMAMGVPLVLVFLPSVWLVLVKLLYPVPVTELRGGRALIRSSLQELGPMNRGEKITLVVFLLTAGLWISRPWLQSLEIAGGYPLAGLTDTGIAVAAALSLFLMPIDISKRTFVMDWETAVKLPWGLLILFGGGLSLAGAVDGNGVAAFLGSLTDGLRWMPQWLIVMSIIAMMIFLTELTSNTATTATLIPVLAALAPGLGIHPYVLIVPAAIVASCAFMLPVATPPNAIVFGSGLITIPQMSRAGLLLNLVGILLVTGLTYSIIIPRLLAS
jgi:sodium-dependent dicarboxylate transporter 2/3/5